MSIARSRGNFRADHEEVPLHLQEILSQVPVGQCSCNAEGGNQFIDSPVGFRSQIVLCDAAAEQKSGSPVIALLGIDLHRPMSLGTSRTVSPELTNDRPSVVAASDVSNAR